MNLIHFVFFLLFYPLCINSFHLLVKNSLSLVSQFSIINNIDKSHNEHHSKEVLFWAVDIMESQNKKFTRSELNIIIQSCILHDLVDKKYSPDEKFVKNYLANLHSTEEIDTIMNIITTMSYSKIFKDNTIIFPDWIQDSPYNECFHITREADLLSSYNIARMIEYRKNLNMPDPMIREEIPIFYSNRIANLIKHRFFLHDGAENRASQLDEIGRLKLLALSVHNLELDRLDYFRFIDFISEDDLSVRLLNLLDNS